MVALNPLHRIFLNFAKNASYYVNFNTIIKKIGVTKLVSSYKRLKLKLRVFLTGHIVAMVTYCAIKLTATCSPMIGQFFYTMILVSNDTEWLK